MLFVENFKYLRTTVIEFQQNNRKIVIAWIFHFSIFFSIAERSMGTIWPQKVDKLDPICYIRKTTLKVKIREILLLQKVMIAIETKK